MSSTRPEIKSGDGTATNRKTKSLNEKEHTAVTAMLTGKCEK